MTSKTKKFLILVGALLVLGGLFTTALGPIYTTAYSTTTSTTYSTLTTITACMSAPGATLTCSTSGTLVYLGTVRYSTLTNITQIVTTFQTPSYTRNYIGILVAVVGAVLGVLGVTFGRNSPTAA